MSLKPGETTQIAMNFTMHAGMAGPHKFRVRLRTNDPLEPEKALFILSNWVE